jgi:hypothetical protein
MSIKQNRDLMVENIKKVRTQLNEDDFAKQYAKAFAIATGNTKKMAKKAADAAIEDIKDQYYDDGYYDRNEVYYTLKRNWQAQGLRHDKDPMFATVFDIVDKWVKKNIK